MRRSKAPSMLNKAKRFCNPVDNNKESELQSNNSDPEDTQYSWGSKDQKGEEKLFTNKSKRIFNIVWRDVTNKKHKTWKGDGTLEVNINTTKAFLKDDTGKYMGCSTKFNIHDLGPDFQMMIGGKEIEIQNEILDEEEIYGLRKKQMNNRNWGAEEWKSPEEHAEEERKPKGGFKFKPVLVLKQPELPQNIEITIKKDENNVKDSWGTKTNRNFSTETSDNWGTNSKVNENIKPLTTFNSHLQLQKLQNNPLGENNRKEFICFIRPSELQQFLFEQVLNYFTSIKQNLNFEKLQSLDFKHILLQICNHPSFVNHKTTTNEVIRHLIPHLPDWSEMGPFDSGKLEFVQYFLNASTKETPENCVIVAKHTNTLNMLQGLCDFMDIKYLRLNLNDSEDKKSEIVEEFTRLENSSIQILLANSLDFFQSKKVPLQNANILFFEDILDNMNILETLDNFQHIKVYYLVTAYTIEELLLLNNFNNIASSNDFSEFMEELSKLSNNDNNLCYLHTKLECKCFENNEESIHFNSEFVKNWNHFINPFDDQFLKISCLENAAENIVTIFYKTHR